MSCRFTLGHGEAGPAHGVHDDLVRLLLGVQLHLLLPAVELGLESCPGWGPTRSRVDLQGPVLLGAGRPGSPPPAPPPAGWPPTAPGRRTGPGGSSSTAGGRAGSPRCGPECAGPAGRPPGSGRCPGGAAMAVVDHLLGDLVEGHPARSCRPGRSSSSFRCQEMASPSRSGSVAR